LGINDLLERAGGLRYEASRERVEVYRVKLEGNKSEVLVQTLSISDDQMISEDFELRPFDRVIVRSISEFAPIESVTLSGELKFPGTYARLDNKNRISDFIKRAGGLSADAFPDGATIIRDNQSVVIELEKIIANPAAPGNMILRPGDEIRVPKPRESVLIYTANTNSSAFGIDSLKKGGIIEVAFQGPKKANWYINNYAGGYANKAKKKDVTVTGAAGEIMETKSFLGIKSYPSVEAGSKIYTPVKPPKKEKPQRERTSWSEIAQVVVAAMTTVATLIIISDRNNP